MQIIALARVVAPDTPHHFTQRKGP